MSIIGAASAASTGSAVMANNGSPIKGAVMYKGCWVAPGCNLYKALVEEKNEKKAAEIARETDLREKQLLDRYK